MFGKESNTAIYERSHASTSTEILSQVMDNTRDCIQTKLAPGSLLLRLGSLEVEVSERRIKPILMSFSNFVFMFSLGLHLRFTTTDENVHCNIEIYIVSRNQTKFCKFDC